MSKFELTADLSEEACRALLRQMLSVYPDLLDKKPDDHPDVRERSTERVVVYVPPSLHKLFRQKLKVLTGKTNVSDWVRKEMENFLRSH